MSKVSQTKCIFNFHVVLSSKQDYQIIEARDTKNIRDMDDLSIRESSSFSSSSSLDGHAAKGLSHICASALSMLFVIIALLIPLDHATHVTIDSGAPSPLNLHDEASHSTPKRGKFVGETFDARDLYEAYKEVETEYHTKAFRDSSKWKILASRQQVEVSMMEHPSDPNCPYVRMVAIIPTSIQDCWNWLSLSNWPTNMPKMDPFYEGIELFGNFDYKGVNMILARKRTKRILAFGKRDMVFLSVSDQPLADGTWVSGSVSVQTPQISRQSGYTRAFQDSIAFYKPLERNTQTQLTIVCRIDLNDSSADGAGGWIPMWLYVKTIGATGLRSFTSMRDEIMLETSRSIIAAKQYTQAIEKDHQPLLKLWRHVRKLTSQQDAGNRHNNDVAARDTKSVKQRVRESGRWTFPWIKKVGNATPVSQDHLPSDVDRHRVRRFFDTR